MSTDISRRNFLREAGGTVSLSRLGDSPEDIAATAGLPCEGARVRIAPDGEVLVSGYRVGALRLASTPLC